MGTADSTKSPRGFVKPRGSPEAGADLQSKYADVLMAAHAAKC